jgi:diguanylate cyclase (GGDEF)-like protein
VADINTKAEVILQAYSTVDAGEGIIIADGLKYAGFLSAHSLLRVINEKNLTAAREQNPLTKLPGNNAIHEYVSQALEETATEHVVVYLDFDNFKPFNDHYGFRLGDRAILLFAELMAKALPRAGCFAGHVGGDDFFAAFRDLDLAQCVEITRALLGRFAHEVESFYDEDTRQRGFLSGHDRAGNPCRFPLLGVSAAIVHLPPGRGALVADDLGHRLAELKKQAKADAGKVALARL